MKRGSLWFDCKQGVQGRVIATDIDFTGQCDIIVTNRGREQGMCDRQNSGDDAVDNALEKIEKAVEALELCQGKLTPGGYKVLRRRLGHLMDTLFKVGDTLSKST